MAWNFFKLASYIKFGFSRPSIDFTEILLTAELLHLLMRHMYLARNEEMKVLYYHWSIQLLGSSFFVSLSDAGLVSKLY